ncbi:hypothetical protein GDO81_001392 [Engystomops pustulosus]|uniref:Uncharacterized protein n=1 Tax=Engystomops pustulosus TaxID=76066 RepID=A0AAV7DC01_ENGPU|nr:hypothetical protein GDO81_001392 [Engystomops pustulosus]
MCRLPSYSSCAACLRLSGYVPCTARGELDSFYQNLIIQCMDNKTYVQQEGGIIRHGGQRRGHKEGGFRVIFPHMYVYNEGSIFYIPF